VKRRQALLRSNLSRDRPGRRILDEALLGPPVARATGGFLCTASHHIEIPRPCLENLGVRGRAPAFVFGSLFRKNQNRSSAEPFLPFPPLSMHRKGMGKHLDQRGVNVLVKRAA